MKIVLVIPTLKQGGAERVISELANIWSKERYSVHIVFLTKTEFFYDLSSDINVHNLQFSYTNKINKTIDELRVLFYLRSILKKENPDFVLSFMTKYNILTLISSIFLPNKIFVSDRSSPKEKLPFFISLLRKLTYRYANGIIAQTNDSKKILVKHTRNKNIEVIFNPLKKMKFFPHIKREKIILNVGRLVSEKGQKYLIEAFSKIKEQDWILVILGEGYLRTELEKQVRFFSLEDKVYMPGSVYDVDNWLAKASIFAFPSISEGFPNGLIEAMAAGLPCVSFDCDTGPRDVISDNINGYLVPIGDIECFYKKIEILINDYELREKIGKEATKIRSQLDLKVISDKYLSFCTN